VCESGKKKQKGAMLDYIGAEYPPAVSRSLRRDRTRDWGNVSNANLLRFKGNRVKKEVGKK